MSDIDKPKPTPWQAFGRIPLGRGILNMSWAGDGYTSNVLAEDPYTLTVAKLLRIARSMPKPPPRVILIEPFYRTEVYTGADLLEVAEPNPAYEAIPSGKVAHAIVRRLGFVEPWGTEEVVFVRADEWRKANA